jgi:20S proteasome alpha/beta subunit
MTRSTIIVATFATSAYELFNTDPIGYLWSVIAYTAIGVPLVTVVLALFFGWWENR